MAFQIQCKGCNYIISLPSNHSNCPRCNAPTTFVALTTEPDPFNVSPEFLSRNSKAPASAVLFLLDQERAAHLIDSCQRKGYFENNRTIVIEVAEDFRVNDVEINRFLAARHTHGLMNHYVVLLIEDPSEFRIETNRQVIVFMPVSSDITEEFVPDFLSAEPLIPDIPRATNSTLQEHTTKAAADQCQICCKVVSLNKGVKLPCNHVFHHKCISKWLKKYTSTCPLCRAPFPTSDPVYDSWRNMKMGDGGKGSGGGSSGGASGTAAAASV